MRENTLHYNGTPLYRNILLVMFAAVVLFMVSAAALQESDDSSATIHEGVSGGLTYTLNDEQHTLVFEPNPASSADEKGIMSSNSFTWGWHSYLEMDSYYDVTFKDGCKEIQGEAVSSTQNDATTPFLNAKIESLNLGTVEKIGVLAFQYQSGNNQYGQFAVDLKNVVTVCHNAFGDAKISSIKFGPALREIEYQAFAVDDTDKIKAPVSIEMCEGIQKIGMQAFAMRQCTSLTIPASLTTIENLAFAGNPDLKSITVASGNPAFKIVDDALVSMDGKRILLFPQACESGRTVYEMRSTVETMDAGSFAFMNVLETLVVSPNVTIIPEAQFFYVKTQVTDKDPTLKQIYLPEGITKVYNTSYQGLGLDFFIVPQSFAGSIDTDTLTGLSGFVPYTKLFVKNIYNYTQIPQDDIISALVDAYNLQVGYEYKGAVKATVEIDGVSSEMDIGTSYSIPVPTKPKCTFLGWTFDPTQCDPDFTEGLVITEDLAGKTSKAVSCWQTTVEYSLNGGTGSKDPTDAKIRGEATLADGSGITAPEGKKFNGWNTKADGTGTHYDAGATMPVSDYTMLYAEWTENSSGGSGSMFEWIVIAAITAATIISIWAAIPISTSKKE